MTLAKIGNQDSHSVVQALIKQAYKLPKELYRSLTWEGVSETLCMALSPCS